MKLIDQINIQFYRSIKDSKIKRINELNVFSGKNDVGKSNILKALDLFFNKTETNFLEDFNKERLLAVRQESVKGKQYIKIQITFNNPGNYSTLPDKFIVTKSWDRLGKLIGIPKDNFDTLVKRGRFTPRSIDISRRTLTGFLNKTRYTYVPAIRDDRFFFHLLSLLQDTLFNTRGNAADNDFGETLKSFNEQIGGITHQLKQEFQSASGIQSTLSFPSEISELFQRLVIDTKSGEHDIPLKLRGDGIRLRYIPTILNHIASKSKYFEIWGFDEPENSCEYGLSKELAEHFQSQYLNHAQIFVSTHSFSFVSLDSSKVARYRVFNKQDSSNSEIIEINKKNELHLQEDIGLLDINRELSKLYDKLQNENLLVEEAKQKMLSYQRPYIIFEGNTDNILFSQAYRSLKGENIEDVYILNEHMVSDNGSSIGSGAPFINEFLKNHVRKLPVENLVVGVFDFDEEGYNQLKGLNGQYKLISIDGFADGIIYQCRSTPNFYGISIVPPEYRLEFTDVTQSQYCHLSIELLLKDEEIPTVNRSYPTKFDKTVFGFKGKKAKFSDKILKKVTDGAEVDFSGFEKTINLIEKLKEITDADKTTN